MRKRDAVQASEKDYRAAEEVVKALAEGLTRLSTDMRWLRRPVGRSWAASGLAC